MFHFNQQRNYRKFVNARDHALDKIYRNHRLKITDILNDAFIQAIQVIKNQYDMMVKNPPDKNRLLRLEHTLDYMFDHVSYEIARQQHGLRMKVYMLAHAGEAQAISQVTDRVAKIKLSSMLLNSTANHGLIKFRHRIDLYLAQVRRDLMQSLQYSIVTAEEEPQAIGRLILSLPKKKPLPSRQVLKKVKVDEAARPSFKNEVSGTDVGLATNSSQGFEWDQTTWDQLIKDYHSDYVPVDRSPENYFDVLNPYNDLPLRDTIPEQEKIYAWEMEQEITHDFVDKVRAGQVDAAKLQGIDEFVWIAIIDDRTCEKCCEWRSGLVTSEIESRLENDPKLSEHCDAVVPPAHFNCRCTLAPASNDLEAVDNTDSNKEFDEWLAGN